MSDCQGSEVCHWYDDDEPTYFAILVWEVLLLRCQSCQQPEHPSGLNSCDPLRQTLSDIFESNR